VSVSASTALREPDDEPEPDVAPELDDEPEPATLEELEPLPEEDALEADGAPVSSPQLAKMTTAANARAFPI
jgi:hypothetical protein